MMITNERWREVISSWLDRPVELSEVQELRDWSQSRVIRMTAKTGGVECLVYAKQARTEHAREAAIYQLADQVQGFPAPKGMTAVIDGEDWLLIEQAAGEQLSRCREIESYREAVKWLASFHQQSLDEGWLERLPDLSNMVEVADELAGVVIPAVQKCAEEETFTELDPILAARVQIELTGYWPNIRRELATYPMNLIHGDSHSGNIFIHREGIQFVDWGSAAVAPGLIDLVGLLDVAARMKNEIGSHEELLKIYWAHISDDARRGYGSLRSAYQVLRICRSLLELDWFSRTDDDYGGRANRELGIIVDAIAILRSVEV